MEFQIKWHKSPKKWKPNLIQRLLIKLKIIKDKRCHAKKVDIFLLDELAHWQDPSIDYDKYWKALREGKKYPDKYIMKWTENKSPTEGTSYYDHTISETPIGTIIIEWKSWKENTSYNIMLDGDWLGAEYNLSDAKTVGLKHVLDKSQELIAFLKIK